MDQKTKKGYHWAFLYSILFFVVGICTCQWREIIPGFLRILLASDILITDYFDIAGIGPTLVNVSIVTLVTVALLYWNKIPMTGGTVVTIGLMSGFSFFGKNFFNMWFILGGTYLFCKIKKEAFSRFLNISLLSTALGPLISTLFFQNGISWKGVLTSLGCGLLIGFVMPMLAVHTERLLHGLNLYNGGFAIGLLALVLVPLLKSYGFQFNTVLHWTTGKDKEIALFLFIACTGLIVGGYFIDPKNAFCNYRTLLQRPGSSRDDFIELDGMGAVLINMGINGILSMAYLFLIEGSLNGPTIGGILTVMGFSAKGKHARNIIPIMLGVALGGMTKQWMPSDPSAQLAALFGTTLAPIAGTYGILAGVAAGFLHSSVVLHAGLGYSGVNLYNNGFAGGITSIVLYSVLSSFVHPNTFSSPSESRKK